MLSDRLDITIAYIVMSVIVTILALEVYKYGKTKYQAWLQAGRAPE